MLIPKILSVRVLQIKISELDLLGDGVDSVSCVLRHLVVLGVTASTQGLGQWVSFYDLGTSDEGSHV